jgi:hypothetical protein
MKKDLTLEEKINFMNISCGVCGMGFTKEGLDLLVSLYELILEKQGSTDIDSISEIQFQAKQREEQRQIEKQKKSEQ